MKFFFFAIISYEVMHYLKRKKYGKKGFTAIKLDMSKVYDKIEWSFMQAILSKMGFTDWWIHLVLKTVTFVSYNIVHGTNVIGPIIPSTEG